MEIKVPDEQISELEFKLWEIGISTQMHFNDLIMKIRAIVLSIITAIFGSSALVLSQSDYFITINSLKIHISVFIIIIGFILLLAHLILDFNYYFRLLLGAVKCTQDLEIKYPILTLTSKIQSKVSEKRAWTSLILYYSLMLITFLSIALALFFMLKK